MPLNKTPIYPLKWKFDIYSVVRRWPVLQLPKGYLPFATRGRRTSTLQSGNPKKPTDQVPKHPAISASFIVLQPLLALFADLRCSPAAPSLPLPSLLPRFHIPPPPALLPKSLSQALRMSLSRARFSHDLTRSLVLLRESGRLIWWLHTYYLRSPHLPMTEVPTWTCLREPQELGREAVPLEMLGLRRSGSLRGAASRSVVWRRYSKSEIQVSPLYPR
jgi:hypothetical protein